MKRILLMMALPVLVGAIFFVRGPSFMRFWKNWLLVSVPLQKADALIVLGGEPLARPLLAAKLFKEGIAPKVFIAGVGDALRNRQVLLAAGVPSKAIIMESKSFTTYTNACFLKPLLESAQVRSALIITSPFHTRRALATFRKVMPDLTFGVQDASIEWWKTPQGVTDVNRFALIEIFKTIEYWLLYGISPMLKR
jgi:uncharacterized SAM-binding protein YcdF (DUF218 family)